jgi:hypothetical protein
VSFVIFSQYDDISYVFPVLSFAPPNLMSAASPNLLRLILSPTVVLLPVASPASRDLPQERPKLDTSFILCICGSSVPPISKYLFFRYLSNSRFSSGVYGVRSASLGETAADRNAFISIGRDLNRCPPVTTISGVLGSPNARYSPFIFNPCCISGSPLPWVSNI